ncbi:hypothetical protein [Kiloniella sp.]|uniref:hypothetical protein n=1 Tax=Kiloniella sp. TaxID=1938587 RepID=UPI003B0260F5
MSRSGDRGERSIALFLLALLLFSPLILSIFNQEDLFFGLPPLYAYLFTAWGGIIAAVGWSASRDKDSVEPYEQDKIATSSYEISSDPSIKDSDQASQNNLRQSEAYGDKNVKDDRDAG